MMDCHLKINPSQTGPIASRQFNLQRLYSPAQLRPPLMSLLKHPGQIKDQLYNIFTFVKNFDNTSMWKLGLELSLSTALRTQHLTSYDLSLPFLWSNTDEIVTCKAATCIKAWRICLRWNIELKVKAASLKVVILRLFYNCKLLWKYFLPHE